MTLVSYTTLMDYNVYRTSRLVEDRFAELGWSSIGRAFGHVRWTDVQDLSENGLKVLSREMGRELGRWSFVWVDREFGKSAIFFFENSDDALWAELAWDIDHITQFHSLFPNGV